ncbi:hypothetical protein SRABI133_02785 [Peribacillus simplex]|uniref:Uncharacterized protein n=1 Tax=Peribacillus simplex TaxID=1478 RepID=A0A9W4KY10_9BACI|nr:hypothetical protein SRABI133_02785 [Peribacillus simplex]
MGSSMLFFMGGRYQIPVSRQSPKDQKTNGGIDLHALLVQFKHLIV